MGKINPLSIEVANLIAAGEVVDRPASAVKELLENAVDSGATKITLEIQRGGVSFIRVADNGCGMEKDDLVPAVTRHSTSKIHTAADLDAIVTLGFRGEALASISAVSKTRIYSKLPGAEFGAALEVEGGDILSLTDTGCQDGTTVIVEDLFYNVPARRKFLKKDSTEAAAVGAVIEKIALSHPDISFRYLSDGELKFMTGGSGDLRETVWALFGKDTAKRSLEVDRRENGIRVWGLVSEPDLVRSNRNMENFFINGRYIRSKTASAALEQAYSSKIPADKFPIAVLNIELNPAAVDVNVHPAKLEVKFANEKLIFDAVYYAVLTALEKAASRPSLPLPGGETKQNNPLRSDDFFRSVPASAYAKPKNDPRAAFVPLDKKPKVGEQMRFSSAPMPEPPIGAGTKEELDDARHAAAENVREAAAFVAAHIDASGAEERDADVPAVPPLVAEERRRAEERPTPAEIAEKMLDAGGAGDGARSDPYAVYDGEIRGEDIPEYQIIGEAFNTYVIVQLSDRLLMVDKHAAHERIIFDELCRKLRRHFREKVPMSGQLLLAPLETDVYATEAEAAEEYRERIEALGYRFDFEENGVSNRRAKITQIPDELDADGALELFHTLAEKLSDATASVESATAGFFESRLWQASCKAAIKGGRVYDRAHLKWICDRLLQKPDGRSGVIRTCPHGRPVAFEIKKTAMDRQFGRLE